MTRYIFVTGGVVSSVGKGIVTASLGRILKARGLQVSILKLDPYINVDPGTMSPYQHGEVFVTDDGAETDLDLGHYERFIDVDLAKGNSSSSGQIYEEVIRKERRGDSPGGTIQAIPHVTNEIKRRIRQAGTALKADVVVIEVGGTVGDIESQPFLEAISQMRYAAAPDETLSIHVTLLPYIGATKELKTKPTQHSVRELRSFGIQPDVDGVLLCPGFGDRGLEGKIAGVQYARERRIPYLGDCLGLQMLVVEFARNVAGLPGANTTEADPKTPFPVISLLSEQQQVHEMGGTMRLGGYDCVLVPGTKAAAAYGTPAARERHRHRYEVNNALLPQLEQAGLGGAGGGAGGGV